MSIRFFYLFHLQHGFESRSFVEILIEIELSFVFYLFCSFQATYPIAWTNASNPQPVRNFRVPCTKNQLSKQLCWSPNVKFFENNGSYRLLESKYQFYHSNNVISQPTIHFRFIKLVHLTENVSLCLCMQISQRNWFLLQFLVTFARK